MQDILDKLEWDDAEWNEYSIDDIDYIELEELEAELGIELEHELKKLEKEMKAELEAEIQAENKALNPTS